MFHFKRNKKNPKKANDLVYEYDLFDDVGIELAELFLDESKL